ncbi:hypothetical protein [Peptostreptococcus equinus]|uniref:Uncharacterized protein n=1 Tax=Peptostreptococcus equinus TaxID=3003601 RepID=A0ABY7JTB8_9FIRM|nr:hypothetical protein [Peptostreptococcus sp. CBA3647]WAW14962.1 hypothetical protein O0R46_00430 [Peptostreptococcus sp. CBA3647]
MTKELVIDEKNMKNIEDSREFNAYNREREERLKENLLNRMVMLFD